MSHARDTYSIRIDERSPSATLLAKGAAFLLAIATMGERFPPAGGSLSIIDDRSGKVVATRSRKVLPIDELQARISRDLDAKSETEFVAKWID